MAIHTVKLYQEYDAPAEQVWTAFSDHENFGRIMGLNIRRIVDSPDSPDVNGAGSVRLIEIPLLPIEETVRKSEKGRLIEYQITKGTPLDYHLGIMIFKNLPGHRSALDYTIELSSRIPLLAWLVKAALQNVMGAALSRYAKGLIK